MTSKQIGPPALPTGAYDPHAQRRREVHDSPAWIPEGTPTRLLHTAIIPLRWGDMDALNHVNNTVYFRFMEQVRIEWLARFNHVTRSAVDSPVVVTASCHFRRPITWPATVVVRLYGGVPGRSSFHTWYEIAVENQKDLSATGEARVVWVGANGGKSVPLPDWVVKQLPARG